MTAPFPPYRISGHESFACRYSWLPKAVRGLQEKPKLFADEEDAMVQLGVGKNMTRAIRFWSQVSGVVSVNSRGTEHMLSDFGKALLADEGYDPFLEDVRTLWLLHWNLSTNVEAPLLAWDFLLNRWQGDLVSSAVVRLLQTEAARHDDGLSEATIERHWETFLHSYFPTRGRKGEVQEDNLDSPLTELEFIVRIGERPLHNREGRTEPVFAFRREKKPDITPELFVYVLNDFWNKRHPTEGTLALREVAHGHGSPGQIFKLPEDDVRVRVEQLEHQTRDFFSYTESATLQQVRRRAARESILLLRNVYHPDARPWRS